MGDYIFTDATSGDTVCGGGGKYLRPVVGYHAALRLERYRRTDAVDGSAMLSAIHTKYPPTYFYKVRVEYTFCYKRCEDGKAPCLQHHSAPPAARLPHIHVIFPLRHSVIRHPSYIITRYQFHCLTSPFFHLSQVRICLHHSSMPYSAAQRPVKEVVV